MGKAHDPRQVRELLARWRRSGLTAHEYAVIAGVSAGTLYRWRRGAGVSRRPVAPSSGFVEVVVPAHGASPARPGSDPGRPSIEIAAPDGLLVRLGPEHLVDDAVLRRVVAALRSG